VRRFRFVIPLLVGVALVLVAAGPEVCDATSAPVAPHAAGHATLEDAGCPSSACPGWSTCGSFGLTSLYFLSSWNFPSIPPVSLSPDPMPPEA